MCVEFVVRDDFPLADGFVISCPVTATGASPVRDIRKRGNIPLVLQQDVVMELKRSDMLESWQSTCALGRKKAQDLMARAASRITTALEDDDTCAVDDLAADMAAFFLLAVREKGLDVKQASRFCEVAWRGSMDEHLSIKRY
jgi:hypothetical protein